MRFDSHADGDRWELQVAGELDAATAAELSERLDEAPAGTTIVLELGSLIFMDSSGLRAILRAHLAGRQLILANPRPEIRRVLEIAGVLDTFPIEPPAD